MNAALSLEASVARETALEASLVAAEATVNTLTVKVIALEGTANAHRLAYEQEKMLRLAANPEALPVGEDPFEAAMEALEGEASPRPLCRGIRPQPSTASAQHRTGAPAGGCRSRGGGNEGGSAAAHRGTQGAGAPRMWP